MGNIRSFEEFADSVKTIIARLAANLISQAIVIPVVSSFAGAIGIPGFGGSSGGSSAGGAVSGLSAASSISQLTGFNPLSGVFSGIGQSINNFGASIGFANPLPAGVAGPPLPGTLFPGASLSGTLGAAGLGALGGGIIAQLTGGSQLGGTIGGGLGAGAGFALGSLTPLGPIGGAILGGVLGGAGGGILGGPFGGKKKSSVGPFSFSRTRVRDGRAVLGTQFADNGGRFDNPATGTQQLVDRANAAINSILEEFQLSLSGVSDPNRRLGISFFANPDKGSGAQRGFFVGSSLRKTSGALSSGAEAVQELVLQVLRSGQGRRGENRIVGASPEIIAALRNTEATDIAGLVSDLQFAASLSDIDLKPEELTQTERAIAAISEQFETLSDRARELGISTRGLERAQSEALYELRTSLEEGARLALLQIEDPKKFALEQLDKTFDAMKKEFESAGADITLLIKRQGLERKAIIERFDAEANREILQSIQTAGAEAQRSRLAIAGDFRSVGQSASAFASGLQFSNDNPAPPAEIFTNARARFDRLFGHAAVLGDLGAGREALALAPQLLQFASEFAPSQAAAVFRDVNASISVIGSSFERRAQQEEDRAKRQMELAERTVELLERLERTAGEASAADQRVLTAIREELRESRIEDERLADALAATVRRATLNQAA